MVRVRETGIFDRCTFAAMSVPYDMFVDKDFEFDIKIEEKRMELDEMKIALGPYMFGIVIAIVAFIIEVLLFSVIVLTAIKSYLNSLLV